MCNGNIEQQEQLSLSEEKSLGSGFELQIKTVSKKGESETYRKGGGPQRENWKGGQAP